MASWSDIEAKYQALSTRERSLILLTGAFLLFMSALVGWLEPLWQQQTNLRKEVAAKSNDLSRLARQVTTLSEQLGKDPNQVLSQRIEEVQQQIDTLDRQLLAQTQNLVPAEQMGNVLQEILAHTSDVKLVSLTSLGAKPYQFDRNAEAEDVGLYRQGMQLVLEGTYFNIQNYLLALEGQPWKFYWETIDYRVADYPKAEVTIEIFTLSTSEAFIGL